MQTPASRKASSHKADQTHKADQNGSEGGTDHNITGIILNALKFIIKGFIILLFIMTDI